MKLQKNIDEIQRIWCPGCGLFSIEKIIAEEMEKVGWNRKNTVLVSGIGCSGRISEYFNLDTMHVSHGRAIPVAEGIKIANPNINVVVISGDGDLLSIGGNHLLHGARRNTNIKVFCNNNGIYAMTGGQSSATTQKNEITKTDPSGSNIDGINIKSVLAYRGNLFLKTNTLETEEFRKCVKKSLNWDGFSFTEIISPCVTDIARKIKNDNILEIIKYFKKAKSSYGRN